MTENCKTVPIVLDRANLLGFDQTPALAPERGLAAKVGVKTLIHFGPAPTLSLAAPIEPVDLDWSRLLGFDQASQPDGDRAMRHGAKVGDKFNLTALNGTLGPKIGPKEAVGFGKCADRLDAKVGFKPSISGDNRLLRLAHLAKVGTKPKG